MDSTGEEEAITLYAKEDIKEDPKLEIPEDHSVHEAVGVQDKIEDSTGGEEAITLCAKEDIKQDPEDNNNRMEEEQCDKGQSIVPQEEFKMPMIPIRKKKSDRNVHFATEIVLIYPDLRPFEENDHVYNKAENKLGVHEDHTVLEAVQIKKEDSTGGEEAVILCRKEDIKQDHVLTGTHLRPFVENDHIYNKVENVEACNEEKEVNMVAPGPSLSYPVSKRRKVKHSNKEEKAYELMKKVCIDTQIDQYSYFGKLITYKLRSLKSERLKKIAQVELLNKLLEIEIMDMQEGKC